MSDDPVRDMAIRILDGAGTISQINLLRLGTIYEDNKVYIEGMFPEDLNDKTFYSSIYIGIKLDENRSNPIHPFGLSNSSNYLGTVVFLWAKDGGRQYFRRGKWLLYIKELAIKFENQRKEIINLNRVDIDDSSLFPDISDD